MPWGTWADWLNVLIAAGVGIAVYRLGSAANRLANATAKAAQMAEAREGRVLLLFFQADVERGISGAEGLTWILDPRTDTEVVEATRDPESALEFATNFANQYAANETIRQRTHLAIVNLAMSTVEESLPRIHILSPEVSRALASAAGRQKSLMWEANKGAQERTWHGSGLNEVRASLVGGLQKYAADLRTVKRAIDSIDVEP